MSVKKQKRLRRARLTRAKIRDRGALRLCVYRSSRHIYVQIITPEGHVLVSTSTLDKAIKGDYAGYTGNIEAAKWVGRRVAEIAKQAGVVKVAFDRSGYKYHGRLAALAEAARAGGLEF